MLLLYCCLSSALAAALGLKWLLLKRGLHEMGQELALILSQDTNRILGLSSRDRDLRRLARILNEQLQLLQKERHRFQDGDRDLKEAVANISHDLRTPLTAVSGYLELLEEEQHSPRCSRYLAIIRERITAMRQLTEELFCYSLALTPKRRQPERLSLNRQLEESLLAFYEAFRKKNITPRITLPDTSVWRVLDRASLSRIFANIIGNAARYSDSDFAVTLSPDGTVSFSNNAPDLSPVSAARLFDRYYTVASLESSTGLGLAIAHRLTEDMGGNISAEYADGQLIIRVCFPEVSPPKA